MSVRSLKQKDKVNTTHLCQKIWQRTVIPVYSLRPKRVRKHQILTLSMWTCMLSCFSHVQFFVTLWAVTHWSPPSVGFCSQKYWSESPCCPSKDLPAPGIEPVSLLLQWQADSLPLAPTGKPVNKHLLKCYTEKGKLIKYVIVNRVIHIYCFINNLSVLGIFKCALTK